LAIANSYDNNVSVLLGLGNGTFATKVNYGVGLNPVSVTSADFNGDGYNDLVTASHGNGTSVSVLLSSYTGTFAAAVSYTLNSSGPFPTVISADFNVDGKQDLVVESGSLYFLLGTGTGTFATAFIYYTGTPIEELTSADFNGDGKADLASVNGSYNYPLVAVIMNTSCLALPQVSVTSGVICNGSSFTMMPSGANTYTYSSGTVVVTPTTNTSYTVTGTDVNGCANKAVSSVTVNTLPTVSVTSGAICAGQSFTMDPSGADNYAYSSGTAVVTPNSNTSYTVTGTDINGCANKAVSSVTVNTAPSSINLTANPNLVCAGGVLSLSAAPNAIPVPVFTENFNGATNNWSTSSNSNGGTPANAAWKLRNSPYTSNVGNGISSNDASQFYLADSDAQGSGGTTMVILKSPATNTNGLTTLDLKFNHFYNFSANDAFAKVDVSTDGTNWTTLKNYRTTGTAGTASVFATDSINLDAYLGNAALYVRYFYFSYFGNGWAIDNVTLSGTPINNNSYAWTSTASGFTASTSTTTDMPIASTTYSVVITNTATSCFNVSSIAVTVNAAPTVSVTSGAICNGQSFTMVPSGADTYTYSSGTAVVTPTTNASYTVTGTDVNGCVTAMDAVSSVTVNAIPTVSVTSGAICAGQSFTMMASGADTYT
jgi:hypothetical protein